MSEGLCNWFRKLIYVRATGPLTVTIASIAICNIFHLYNPPYNIQVVGTIPKVGLLDTLAPLSSYHRALATLHARC